MAITPFLSNEYISDYFCAAGIEMVSIDPIGNIWPCHLTVLSEHQLSNITSFNLDDFNRARNYLHKTNKTNEKCQKWIASYYCHKCLKIMENQELICDNAKLRTEQALEFMSDNIDQIDLMTARLFYEEILC